jgi:hypothetical protein
VNRHCQSNIQLTKQLRKHEFNDKRNEMME